MYPTKKNKKKLSKMELIVRIIAFTMVIMMIVSLGLSLFFSLSNYLN